MNNRIGPTVKDTWKAAMYVLHYFFGLFINTTAYHLGRNCLHLLQLKNSMAYYSYKKMQGFWHFKIQSSGYVTLNGLLSELFGRRIWRLTSTQFFSKIARVFVTLKRISSSSSSSSTINLNYKNNFSEKSKSRSKDNMKKMKQKRFTDANLCKNSVN